MNFFFISSTLKFFLRGKVRQKIADCLESGYALTLLPACKGLHEGGRTPDIRNGAGGLLKGQGVFAGRR